MRRVVFGVLLALAAVLLLPAAGEASDARGNHAAYQFLAGVEPGEGPDQAMSADGSTVELTGTGSFMVGPDKSATCGGESTIAGAGGNRTSSGTWSVVRMLRFVDYGDGAPQGAPGVNGGQLRLMVLLSNGDTGVLTITCVLGSPPAGMHEGVTLVLGSGGQFTKSTEGETAFVPV